MPRLLAAPTRSLVARLRRWPVESQLGSRRNAMTACTALAARRAERQDVEDYLRTGPPVPAPGAARAARA